MSVSEQHYSTASQNVSADLQQWPHLIQKTSDTGAASAISWILSIQKPGCSFLGTA